jgi:hypothetical protein
MRTVLTSSRVETSGFFAVDYRHPATLTIVNSHNELRITGGDKPDLRKAQPMKRAIGRERYFISYVQ